MKFDIIDIDPPWEFDDTLKKMKSPTKRSAASQYATMSPAQICAMKVEQLANPEGCLVALWTPTTMTVHGLEALKAWGFTFKQEFIWVKIKKNALQTETDMNRMTRIGLGRIFRQVHEKALIGIRNKVPGKSVYKLLQDRSQRSVAFDLNRSHSTKPPTLQDRLDIMFPTAKRLEMFARRNRPGWTSIGDGVTGRDINDSIEDLLVL